jgi:homoserine trans-succinylase
MTSKEKAIQLVNKFYNEVKYMERAKQCALIAVDELIKETDWSEADYWQEVKQEIEKL